MLSNGQWNSNSGDWSSQANANLAANWVVSTDIAGSSSDIPLSGNFSFIGMSSGTLISELETAGFTPHTLDDLLGATGGGHPGRNLRDSKATCSIHFTINPGSGQYGKPITGSWHIDEYNPFTYQSSTFTPLQGFILHATQDVGPDIVHDKNIDRSVIPGNRNCPHNGEGPMNESF